MFNHFFLQLEVKMGFLRQKEGPFQENKCMRKSLYMNWKGFKILFLKKWFNLVFPVSILPSYIRNRSIQRQLQYIVKFPLWAVCNFSSHFSCALSLSLPPSMEIWHAVRKLVFSFSSPLTYRNSFTFPLLPYWSLIIRIWT